MADRNSYLKYKRDQKLLVYWITHASNRIVQSAATNSPVAANFTGQISLATLKSMAELIARHIKPIPTTIFRLFNGIIEARREVHMQFQGIVANNPDPDIERSNASHKYWIDGLTQAFNVLGGNAWLSEQNGNSEGSDEVEEEVIFSNTFAILSINGPADETDQEGAGREDEAEDIGEGGDEQASQSTATARLKKKHPTKKKKGRRVRKTKANTKTGALSGTLDDVPLESYCIIEDEADMITEYLMAVYSLVQHWADLRHYLQGVWRQVAYEGLNSAVAAALSNIAIGMVKDTQSQIFVDFSGHDSFETVTNAITQGDPDAAQSMFGAALFRVTPGGASEVLVYTYVDLREELMIHCYQDLVDFLVDYQQNRNGKPTKSMMKKIDGWDPKADLEQLTKKQRLEWRRAYTINWLYDLVNLNTAVIAQRQTMTGQTIRLEHVDWSVNGPWSEHRRLCGINEFAAEITHLAVQKPGSEIQRKILPHLVFQLQCLVDSMTVSRGWSIHFQVGHAVTPPAAEFRPRRDVDLFMDREGEWPQKGFIGGFDVLTHFFDRDSMLHGNPNRHDFHKDLLNNLCEDFFNWFGESRYKYGLKDVPPSRFSNTNANGLWEYSPFLCGAGLMEALEIAQGMGFLVWDSVPGLICAIHIHNMLVQKGYISQPIGLYSSLQALFKHSIFTDGKVPRSKFDQAFQTLMLTMTRRRPATRRRDATPDFHGILNGHTYQFFKNKPFLRLLRAAEWDPDRIPDDEVPLGSYYGFMRLGDTKRVKDPATGHVVLEDTGLVKRARAIGLSDTKIIDRSTQFAHESQTREHRELPASVHEKVPEGYTMDRMPDNPYRNRSSGCGAGTTTFLDMLKFDLAEDICGDTWPFSGINYLGALIKFYAFFMRVEDELQKRRNPLWVEAYEENPILMRAKRPALTMLALKGEDEECLEVMADVLQSSRENFRPHIYWHDLQTFDSLLGMVHNDSPTMPNACTIM